MTAAPAPGARWVTRPAVKIGAGLIAGTFALAALLIGLVLWRLSSGPIDVAFLAPYIEGLFVEMPSGQRLLLKETTLAWNTETGAIDIRAQSPRMVDRQGTVIAKARLLRVSLSGAALLHGTIAVSAIEAEDEQLRLIRTRDGNLLLGAPGESADRQGEHPEKARPADVPPGPGTSEEVLDIVSLLTAAPDNARPLTYLKTVSVSNGELSIDDCRSGTIWHLRGVALRMRGADDGTLHAELRIPHVSPAVVGSLEATLTLAAGDKVAHATVSVTDLAPARLAEIVPQAGQVAALDLPISGSLAGSIARDGELLGLDFEANAGEGRLAYPELLPSPLTVLRASVNGRFDGAADSLTVEQAEVAFGTAAVPGPTLSAAGNAERLSGDVRIAATATIAALPLASAKEYWPAALAPGGRAWVVANIPAGVLDSLTADVELSMPGGDVDALLVKRISGGLAYHELEVHYLRPLPPITGITGTGSLDLQTVRFKAPAGNAGRLQVSGADIEITGLDADEQEISIDVGVEGPLRDAFELLDNPRLDLLSGIGIKPSQTTGRMRVQTHLAFPLLAALTLDQMRIRAEGKVIDAAITGLFSVADVSHANLSFALGSAGNDISGDAQLGGIPLTVQIRQAFARDAPYRLKVHATAPRIEERQLAGLDLDLGGYLSGVLSGVFDVTLGDEGAGTGSAALDLRQAALNLPQLHWRKERDVPGESKLELLLEKGQLAAIRHFSIRAGSLTAAGSGRFDPQTKSLASAEFTQLAIGETTVSDVTIRRERDGYHVAIGGGVVDARPFIARKEGPEKAPSKAERTNGGGSRLTITAPRLERIMFAPDRSLTDVALHLVRDRAGWQAVDVEGRVPATPGSAAATFAFRYGPPVEGNYPLSGRTDDGGSLLRALDLSDGIVGGRVTLSGRGRGPLPDGPVDVAVSADGFAVARGSPQEEVLSRATSAESPQKKVERTAFKHFDGKFTLDRGRLTIRSAGAYSPSLAVTGAGTITLADRRVEMQGAVVPLRKLNRLIGKIPILGGLFGGGGEGFLSIQFDVTGSLDDPQISTRTLALITPALLRNFEDLFAAGGNGRPAPVEPP